MNARPVEDLVEALCADVRPVRPLAGPIRRALTTLGIIALFGGAAIYLLGDVQPLLSRYSGREVMLAAEMLAILATGMLAVIGAFFAAIPGRSQAWRLAPLPAFVAWLLLSGMGCYRDLVRSGPSGWEIGYSMECLVFILAVSLVLGVPLAWRLSRARPIDSLPVALLAGLGTAALSAFLLLFFHDISVTFIDLAIHLVAILFVIATAALLRRQALSPA